MALPSDMQVVQVVLLAEQVKQIDQLARSQRQSRSEFLRLLITDGLVAFSLPAGFSEEPKVIREHHATPDPVAK